MAWLERRRAETTAPPRDPEPVRQAMLEGLGKLFENYIGQTAGAVPGALIEAERDAGNRAFGLDLARQERENALADEGRRAGFASNLQAQQDRAALERLRESNAAQADERKAELEARDEVNQAYRLEQAKRGIDPRGVQVTPEQRQTFLAEQARKYEEEQEQDVAQLRKDDADAPVGEPGTEYTKRERRIWQEYEADPNKQNNAWLTQQYAQLMGEVRRDYPGRVGEDLAREFGQTLNKHYYERLKGGEQVGPDILANKANQFGPGQEGVSPEFYDLPATAVAEQRKRSRWGKYYLRGPAGRP